MLQIHLPEHHISLLNHEIECWLKMDINRKSKINQIKLDRSVNFFSKTNKFLQFISSSHSPQRHPHRTTHITKYTIKPHQTKDTLWIINEFRLKGETIKTQSNSNNIIIFPFLRPCCFLLMLMYFSRSIKTRTKVM